MSNLELFDRHESKMDQWADKAPVCDKCHKPIMDPHLYDMWGEVYCEACVSKRRRDINDYM